LRLIIHPYLLGRYIAISNEIKTSKRRTVPAHHKGGGKSAGPVPATGLPYSPSSPTSTSSSPPSSPSSRPPLSPSQSARGSEFRPSGLEGGGSVASVPKLVTEDSRPQGLGSGSSVRDLGAGAGGGSADGVDQDGGDAEEGEADAKAGWVHFRDEMDMGAEEPMYLALETRTLFSWKPEIYIGVFWSRGRPGKASNPINLYMPDFLGTTSLPPDLPRATLERWNWFVLGRTECMGPEQEKQARDASASGPLPVRWAKEKRPGS
jgi:hypothetical protein